MTVVGDSWCSLQSAFASNSTFASLSLYRWKPCRYARCKRTCSCRHLQVPKRISKRTDWLTHVIKVAYSSPLRSYLRMAPCHQQQLCLKWLHWQQSQAEELPAWTGWSHLQFPPLWLKDRLDLPLLMWDRLDCWIWKKLVISEKHTFYKKVCMSRSSSLVRSSWRHGHPWFYSHQHTSSIHSIINTHSQAT